MKRFLVLMLLLVASAAWAENPTDGKAEYYFGTVAGGTDNCLDGVDGALLSGGETAWISYEFGTVNQRVKWSYYLDPSCTETPDDFAYVQPDSNPGTKMWVIDVWPSVVADDCTAFSLLIPSGWEDQCNERP